MLFFLFKGVLQPTTKSGLLNDSIFLKKITFFQDKSQIFAPFVIHLMIHYQVIWCRFLVREMKELRIYTVSTIKQTPNGDLPIRVRSRVQLAANECAELSRSRRRRSSVDRFLNLVNSSDRVKIECWKDTVESELEGTWNVIGDDSCSALWPSETGRPFHSRFWISSFTCWTQLTLK